MEPHSHSRSHEQAVGGYSVGDFGQPISFSAMAGDTVTLTENVTQTLWESDAPCVLHGC